MEVEQLEDDIPQLEQVKGPREQEVPVPSLEERALWEPETPPLTQESVTDELETPQLDQRDWWTQEFDSYQPQHIEYHRYRSEPYARSSLHVSLVAEYVDWDIALVGRAVMKELRWSDLSDDDKQKMQEAMDKEWQKWIELKAVRYCSTTLFKKLQKEHKDLSVIGTRWVLVRKADGRLKARLVVQGCQEAPGSYRRDAPTCSPLAFMLVLAFAAQKGWTVGFYDAQAAFLQTEGISRLLVLRLPAENPPKGTLPNQIVIANASIYGTRDAPRAWYLRLKSIMADLELLETQLEKSLFVWRHAGEPRIVLATHVDDLIVAWRLRDAEAYHKIEMLIKRLLLKDTRGGSKATYCGKLIEILDDKFFISQPKALDDLEVADIHKQRSTEVDSKLTAAELTTYRSIWGQLSWLALQTRPDLAVETNLVAQRTEKATISDLKILNTLVLKALATRDRGLVIPRNQFNVLQSHLLYYGDSAFANADGCKSQFGVLGCLVSDVTRFIAGNFFLGIHSVLAFSNCEACCQKHFSCRSLCS